jgi:hypothetical protein
VEIRFLGQTALLEAQSLPGVAGLLHPEKNRILIQKVLAEGASPLFLGSVLSFV